MRELLLKIYCKSTLDCYRSDRTSNGDFIVRQNQRSFVRFACRYAQSYG